MRVVGIEPGSRHTGWGVIDIAAGGELTMVKCGVISTSADDEFSQRLVTIYDEVAELLKSFDPDGAAIEAVFHARNASSALKLGHARAAALLACAHHGLNAAEYAPKQVKRAVTGSGGADKSQVARMVEMLVGRTLKVRNDATDAVAIAICHAAIGLRKVG